MTNSAEQLIFHAATLMEDDDLDGAVAALHESIELAAIAKRPLELLRARFMLGEIFAAADRNEEAVEQFEEVLLLGETFTERDLVDEELSAARAGLESLLPDDE